MNRLIDFKSRFRILKGGKVSLVVSAFLGGAIIASAAPSDGVVTSGNANISQSGNTTNINQSSNKASINWNKFDIATNETVNFNQPNSSSITLNRVIGNEKSVIDGALNANGQVWILNSNGVLFNSTATINTAGILATTSELSDSDFQNGNYNFKNSSKNSVINLGTIEVVNSGYVVLASNEVKNSGTIKAVKGKVHLVGADEYTLNLNGNSLVNLIVNKGVLDSMVENSGTIIADGGEVYLTTNAVNELLKGVVNNTGIIEANSLDGLMGKVEVFAHGGEVQVGGTIEAKDGFVETSGKTVDIKPTVKVKAKEWLIDPTNITITDATAYENSLNGGTNVTIETLSTGSEDGDINVNDEITWNAASKLTLKAHNDIFINKSITAEDANGKLALHYGQSAVASGNTSTYNVNAKVNLKAGDNFYTKLGNDVGLNETTWTVVTDATSVQGMSHSGNTVLGTDVDASGIAWTPIRNSTTKFTGTFDGLGHTIDNLTINSSDNFLGLFGWTDGATIKNVGVINVNITGGGRYVGGLVGANINSTITNSYVTGSVTGSNYVGGLVGSNDTSTITNSYATGSVTVSGSQAGGLVGFNYNSSITNSYATGSVTVSGSQAGGLVGNNNGSTITNSYASGAVTGTTNVGGLVGINETTSYTKITNSYATGAITGTTNVGGLVGWNRKEIINSYASGTVTGTTNVGGLTGNNDAAFVITNSFYDKDTNTTMSDTNLGKTKLELLALTKGVWKDTQWIARGNDIEGYTTDIFTLPVLKTFYTPTATLFNSGYGTALTPYTITNWTQLQNINNSNILTNAYHFDLLNSIDKTTADYTDLASASANSGAGWNPLGYHFDHAFIGTFDGLGNTISDLYINRPTTDYIGLFGFTSGSIIENIGLVNVNVTGDDYVGALLGVSPGANLITNAYASGIVKGKNNVGGLIGQKNNTHATTTNSYASVTVTGTGTAIGGLIGSSNYGTITNSFYDSTKNPTSVTHAGVTGKTTEELSYGKTFKDASWDIVADSSVTSLTPVLKYNSTTSLYYWAIAPLDVTYTLSDESKIYDGITQNLNDLYTNVITTNADLVGSAYKFQVNNTDVTGYKDAGTYENIKVVLDGTNDFLAIASSGNTDGKYVIKQKTVTPTPTPTPTPPVVENKTDTTESTKRIQAANLIASSITKNLGTNPRLGLENKSSIDEESEDENSNSNTNDNKVALYKGSIIKVGTPGINLPGGL